MRKLRGRGGQGGSRSGQASPEAKPEPRARRKFQRIYFDTNALEATAWPRVSAALENVATLASLLHVGLIVPEAVKLEHEEHWIRDFEAGRSAVAGAIGQAKRRLRWPNPEAVEYRMPTREEALARYRHEAEAAGMRLDFTSCPWTTRAVGEFFAMAARQESPFGEDDKGFRDAVILLSVIDHLKAAEGVVGALVTRDAAFHERETAELVGRNGAHLEIFRTVDDVLPYLTGRLELRRQQAWERDREAAKLTLERMLAQIEEFVAANLVVWPHELGVSEPVVAMDRIAVVGLGDVRTPFPPERTEGETVKLSFDVQLDVGIRVRPLRWAPPPPRLRVEGEKVAPFGLADLMRAREEEEPRLITRTAEVEATAAYRGGEYHDVRLGAVRFKGATTPAGLLGALTVGATTIG